MRTGCGRSCGAAVVDLKPGLVLDSGRGHDEKRRARVALVGKVFCKVDADPEPIDVGDLLTLLAWGAVSLAAASRAFRWE